MSGKSINDADALLVFSVGPVLCCTPTITVEAVILPPTLHKPPGSDRNHPGVFRHSRGMVSVVDLRQRFGVSESNWCTPGRMVVAEITGGFGGFLVDSIVDVMQLPKEGWGALPALVPRQVFKRTLLLDNKIHLYADFEDLYNFRESGYLRAHIALLEEKQRQPQQQITVASVLAVPSLPVSQENNAVVKPDTTKEFVTEWNSPESTPARPAIPQQQPFKVQKNSAIKSAEVSIRRNALPLNKPLAKPVPLASHKMATHETSAMAQPAELPTPQREPSTRDGHYMVWSVMAVVLVALLFGITRFDLPEAVKEAPGLQTSINNPDVVNAVEDSADSEYQASITHDAEGIVITIDTTDDILPDQTGAQVPVINQQPDVVVANEKIIVHVVVKGDTLWAIANLYVRDPWRYPELAKLSNIKNPHRIYPGNKVKIVLRNTGNTKFR